jgi:hypothetical protein
MKEGEMVFGVTGAAGKFGYIQCQGPHGQRLVADR